MNNNDIPLPKDSSKVYNENHMQNCNVFLGDMHGCAFGVPGTSITINNYPSSSKPAKKPEADKPAPDSEGRDRLKERVLDNIISRLRFTDTQLGRDSKGKKITNDRLGHLMRKCLGMSISRPSESHKLVIDQLWTLLIDKRPQCAKDAELGYIKQTVLNLIGYFRTRSLISDTPLSLARSVFNDADVSMARNVERGITSSCFGENTSKMMDFYIDQLLNGTF